MKIEKEEQYVKHYTEYYCDECGKYIGRDDREYDRLYMIRKTTLISIPEFNLRIIRYFCCEDCKEKAKAELILNLKNIGFCDNKKNKFQEL